MSENESDNSCTGSPDDGLAHLVWTASTERDNRGEDDGQDVLELVMKSAAADERGGREGQNKKAE